MLPTKIKWVAHVISAGLQLISIRGSAIYHFALRNYARPGVPGRVRSAMSKVMKAGEKAAFSSRPPPKVEVAALISQSEILKSVQMLVDKH
jgi:hypothetical protein